MTQTCPQNFTPDPTQRETWLACYTPSVAIIDGGFMYTNVQVSTIHLTSQKQETQELMSNPCFYYKLNRLFILGNIIPMLDNIIRKSFCEKNIDLTGEKSGLINNILCKKVLDH